MAWFALALLLAASPVRSETDESLRFRIADERVASLSRADITASCELERVTVDDPYYERSMTFLACPLGPLLERGFGKEAAELAKAHFFLRARDGYTRPADGVQLLATGGWIALADAELAPNRGSGLIAGSATSGSPFRAIDRRQVDPAPYYMIWSEPGQQDPHRWPWPYQWVEIEMAPFASRFPWMEPRGEEPGSPPMRGYASFRRQCVSCHSINGDGGKVGPELNVPKSIVEYRPAAQIKAYIRNPESFRYTSMPAHPDLDDAALDDLLAYFRAMSLRKHDPRDASGQREEFDEGIER